RARRTRAPRTSGARTSPVSQGARIGRKSFKHQSKGRAPAGATSAGSCQLVFTSPLLVGSSTLVPLQQYVESSLNRALVVVPESALISLQKTLDSSDES